MQAGWGLSPRGASHLHPDFSPRPVSTVGGGARAESGGSEAEDAGVQSHEVAGTEGQFPGEGLQRKHPEQQAPLEPRRVGLREPSPSEGTTLGKGQVRETRHHCLEWTPTELRSRLHHCQENTIHSGEKLAKPSC